MLVTDVQHSLPGTAAPPFAKFKQLINCCTAVLHSVANDDEGGGAAVVVTDPWRMQRAVVMVKRSFNLFIIMLRVWEDVVI